MLFFFIFLSYFVFLLFGLNSFLLRNTPPGKPISLFLHRKKKIPHIRHICKPICIYIYVLFRFSSLIIAMRHKMMFSLREQHFCYKNIFFLFRTIAIRMGNFNGAWVCKTTIYDILKYLKLSKQDFLNSLHTESINYFSFSTSNSNH